jgi:FAD/FMN-containing dehydrogenase
MLKQHHINALRGIVGSKHIQTRQLQESLDGGITKENLAAEVLLLPASVEILQATMRYCTKHSISVVPHGGRTGLSGGALSSKGQIIIQSSKLNQLIDLDFVSGTALLEAGATLQQLQEAIKPYGFSTGIDLAARGTATIGGMAATNAGGTEAFRHGVMRHRILGLEAVLPNGDLFSDLKQVTKANEGYDIKQLFIGAEGTLGIITKIVIDLVPAEPYRSTALISCENALSAATVFQVIRKHKAANILCAEIMWPDYARLTAEELKLSKLLSFAHNDSDVFVVLDIAKDSAEDDTHTMENLLSELLEAEQITSALIAQNTREAEDFWRLREESFLCDKRYPHGFWYDVSVPLGELDVYTESLFTNIKQINPNLHVFLFGHLGDGNLHLTISSGYPCPELHEQIDCAVYDMLTCVGGSFSAEHGIGNEKIPSLKKYCDKTKLNLMQVIKKQFDPTNIMNPSKVLPTIRNGDT